MSPRVDAGLTWESLERVAAAKSGEQTADRIKSFTKPDSQLGIAVCAEEKMGNQCKYAQPCGESGRKISANEAFPY